MSCCLCVCESRPVLHECDGGVFFYLSLPEVVVTPQRFHSSYVLFVAVSSSAVIRPILVASSPNLVVLASRSVLRCKWNKTFFSALKKYYFFLLGWLLLSAVRPV